MKKSSLRKMLCCSLSALMSAACVFSAVGCGGEIPDDGGEFNEEIDTTKTQLYVGNYNGGFGWEWLNKAKQLYEAEHPDVQIMIDNDKDLYSPANLKVSMPNNRQDLYVLDGTDYYDFVAEGHFMDVTDIVTAGGENSIESKMYDSLRTYYKTSQNKYYAVPFYLSYFTMIYDVDLFDEYYLWLNEEGTGFVQSLDEPRYVGLSGEVGAWDYGLPQTYSQFFMLLDQMVAYSIVPVTWTGKYKDGYLPYFTDSIWADYSGPEGFGATYSLSGNVKTVNNYDFTDSPTGTFYLPEGSYSVETVTKENAQQVLPRDAGKYYAIKFAKDLTSGNYKYLKADKVNSPSESHTQAQDTFLRSRYLAEKKGTQPIAMLVEGGWWFNEAKVVFEEMSSYGSQWSEEGRRLGIMPIPKADDGSSAPGRTVRGVGTSVICISNYTTKAELAKDFFAFINSEEIMKLFTKETNAKRPYNYELTEEETEAMPYYAQNMLDMLSDINVQYTLPRTAELIPYASKLSTLGIQSIFNNYAYSNPITNFFENPSVTANTYFKGLQTYQANNPIEW